MRDRGQLARSLLLANGEGGREGEREREGGRGERSEEEEKQ